VAVSSAEPYASQHLAPDRQPRQHPTTQFLQTGCPFCRPTNSIKALKATTLNFNMWILQNRTVKTQREVTYQHDIGLECEQIVVHIGAGI